MNSWTVDHIGLIVFYLPNTQPQQCLCTVDLYRVFQVGVVAAKNI